MRSVAVYYKEFPPSYATALGSNYAVNDQDFHWIMVYEFERHDEKYPICVGGVR